MKPHRKAMVKLEKFDKSDYDRLIGWIDSEELMIQFSGPVFSFPLTCEQLNKYLLVENRVVYRVLDSSTNEIVGHAELNNIDEKNRNARICRVLIGHKCNRNKGYGRAVIKELINVGFNELKLHRLDLGVFDFNQQAIKCYSDCGFEIEGVFRENYKVGDQYWSCCNMSIINKNI
jgi:RimJ/RimL family protein N-acetyltransferase